MLKRLRRHASLAAILIPLLATPAFAEPTGPADDPAQATPPPAPGWAWRKASLAEYLTVPAAVGATLYVEKQNGKPAKARWKSRNDFDEGIRDALRLDSREARDAAQTASDAIMALMMAAPVADSYFTLGWRDARWEALWQTEMINLESFTFTALVASVMQNAIARERPFVRNCTGGNCEDSQINRSMPSGHMAFAVTGAGLLCTHHKYQSLYNDPTADDAVCYAGIGVATVEGFLRIMSDRHYATDVLAGTGIGLFSGVLLPRLLHYYWPQQKGSAELKKDTSLVKHFMVAPQLYGDGGGLNCEVTF